MEQMTTKRPAGLSSLELKLLAMGTMLVDHIGWGFFPMELWLRGIGRLAFPIFAFQAAEGWARSHDRRRYLLRMALFALLSELPFDLLFSGQLWNAGEQNVLWTFTIALGCLWAAEWLQRRGLPEVLALLCVAVPGYLLGQWLAVDYYGGGVLMVLVFALCRDKKWRWPVELAAMLVINGRLLPSAYIELGGHWMPIQLLATAALLPIWLYRGHQGPHHRAVQLLCYGFYPVHLLLLALLLRLGS